MTRTKQIENVERWAREAAVVVGRFVVRGISRVPRVVACASGIAQPSVPATVAGIVSAGAVLARAPLGPIGGACIELGGVAAVFAIATCSVRTHDGIDACVVVLGAMAGDAALVVTPEVLPALARSRVSRALARTLGGAAVPLRAWSAMGRAARLVDAIERTPAPLTAAAAA